MDAIREGVKRSIEALLDEWVEISMFLPDTSEKRALNERCARLEEALLQLDGDLA